MPKPWFCLSNLTYGWSRFTVLAPITEYLCRAELCYYGSCRHKGLALWASPLQFFFTNKLLRFDTHNGVLCHKAGLKRVDVWYHDCKMYIVHTHTCICFFVLSVTWKYFFEFGHVIFVSLCVSYHKLNNHIWKVLLAVFCTSCILKMLQLKWIVKLQFQACKMFTCSRVACFILRLCKN